MKKLIYLLVLVGITGFAQIKGNKNIETKSYELSKLEVVKINFYAKITIDQSAPEGMSITTDSNLFEYIDTEVVDGVLNLDQIKWISPSQDAKIVIGAPNLKRVEHGTHDYTKLVNIKSDALSILATYIVSFFYCNFLLTQCEPDGLNAIGFMLLNLFVIAPSIIVYSIVYFFMPKKGSKHVS